MKCDFCLGKADYFVEIEIQSCKDQEKSALVKHFFCKEHSGLTDFFLPERLCVRISAIIDQLDASGE
jgi:hypothetical protein